MDRAEVGVDRVRFGTAGWSYPDWKGPVYGSTGARGLGLLSSVFDVVELNSSFYRPPSPRAAAGWLKQVAAAPRFQFTAKLWRGFTHERAWDSAAVASFRAGLEPLHAGGRLAAVLMQFPWSFHHGAASWAVVERLAEAFAGWPLVLEVRHRSWEQPQVLDALVRAGIGFCNIDQPIFPGSLGLTAHVSSPVGYLRLHGRNAADWFRPEADRDQRYHYNYTPAELESMVPVIRALARSSEQVFVVTNNHFAGNAVFNAIDLRYLLTGQQPAVPRRWLSARPGLPATARSEPGETLSLFH